MKREITMVEITHSTNVEIGEGRLFSVKRAHTGQFQLEWTSPDEDNGRALISTKIILSEEAAMATALGLSDLICKIEAEAKPNAAGEKP